MYNPNREQNACRSSSSAVRQKHRVGGQEQILTWQHMIIFLFLGEEIS